MKKPDISSKVMQEINSKSVSMRPRWYFTILTAISIISVFILSSVSVYLINIFTLIVRIESNERPMYGARSILSDLILNFPWWMVIVAVFCLGLLIWLLRRNSTVYRYSIGKTIGVVVAISLLLGILLSYLPINQLHGGQGYGGRNGQGQQHYK